MEKSIVYAVISLLIGIVIGAAIVYAFQFQLAPEGEKQPFKIGAICGFTGRTATQGYRVRVGWDLCLEDMPTVLNGRPIEMIIEDHQSSVDACVEAYRKLIDVDGVSILVVAAGSSFQLASVPYAQEKGIPVVSIVATSNKTRTLGEQGGYYSVIAVDVIMGKAAADAAFNDWGAIGKFGVFAMDDPYGRGVAGAFADAAVDLGGEKISEVYYEPGKSDYRAEITALFAEQLDTVFSVSWETDSAVIFKNAYELGFYETVKGHWYSPYLSDVVITPDPDEIEGLRGLDPSFIGDRGAKFVERVLEKDPDLIQPGYYPVKGYDALQVAITAINLAGADDPEKINEKLPLALEMVLGLSGPSLAVKDGVQTDEVFAIVEYTNGELVELGKLVVAMPDT